MVVAHDVCALADAATCCFDCVSSLQSPTRRTDSRSQRSPEVGGLAWCLLGYRIFGFATSAMSKRAAEARSERVVVIHFGVRVGVRLMVQAPRDDGTQEVASVYRKRAFTLAVSHGPGNKRHATARRAKTRSLDASMPECGSRPEHHSGRGLNQASNASSLRLNLLKVAPSLHGSFNIARCLRSQTRRLQAAPGCALYKAEHSP